MSIIRVKKERQYVSIANAMLQNKNLSWEARGVMAYLLSKPDGWECRNYDLVNQGPASAHVIRRVLKELQEAGYIYRYQKSEGRSTIEWITEIYESPELNTAFRNTNFSQVENFESESFKVEKLAHIISTDYQQELTTKKTDLIAKPQNSFSDSEKADLNKLTPFFANQCNGQLDRDGLKAYVLLGYQMSKELCPVNIKGASDKTLKDLARAAWLVEDYSDQDQDQILKKYKAWWYTEYWAGKKGQAPTPAQVGDTWGQFEAKESNAMEQDNNKPKLTPGQLARLRELQEEWGMDVTPTK